MKILLACLMCLVLGASECFGISGGPVFGGAGVTVTGTYAGVLVPLTILVGNPPAPMTDNSLALFTLTIPRVDLATGNTAVFRNGVFYSGTIQGLADPDTAKLTAVVNAVNDVTASSSSTASLTTATFSANGKFEHAKIVASTSSSFTSARIRGTASVTYTCVCTGLVIGTGTLSCPPCDEVGGDSGGPVVYKIRGFKQSS
jgi:hypothetical protein